MTNPNQPQNPPHTHSKGARALGYLAIFGIFIAFTIASLILGLRFSEKHRKVLSANEMGVSERWGGAITQGTAVVTYLFEPAIYDAEGNVLKAEKVQRKIPASDITADLSLSYRKRGQMEFPGYEVVFNATYIVGNSFDRSLPVSFFFPAPAQSGLTRDFVITVDDENYTGDQDFSDGVMWEKRMAPGEEHVIHVTYNSRGMGDWAYGLSGYQSTIPSFKLKLTSDFADIDYPDGSMVPTTMDVDEEANTALLAWEFSNLVSGQNIGVSIPRPLDIGTATSRVLFVLPLALLFFLGLVVVLTSIKGRRLHAMHVLLISGGFFVFHILMSYLTVLIPLTWAFLASAGVSWIMTLGYAALIRKGWPVLFSAGLGLVLFQTGFSLAQFFPEIRGLIIAFIIIAGLGTVMGFTARVDWKGKL